MKYALIFLLVINSFVSLHAQEVRKEKERIILSDDSCDKVFNMSQALAKWSVSTKSNKLCPLGTRSPKVNSVTKKCEYDITDCVPDHVVTYHGANPKYAGPNCWNLALVMKAILPSLRYSGPEEMSFYMRPPLCRQLKNDEEKIPGDVGAIRDMTARSPEEYHGFIYISDDIAYSKNGFANTSPFALQPLEKVLDIYQVPSMEECRSNELSFSNNCGKAISYFRCVSMDEYLKKAEDLPSFFVNSLSSISSYEDCLQETTMKAIPVSTVAQNNIVDALNALSFYVGNEIQETNRNPNPSVNFVIGSMKLRLEAIAKQLKFNNDENNSSEISKFADRLRHNLNQLKGRR